MTPPRRIVRGLLRRAADPPDESPGTVRSAVSAGPPAAGALAALADLADGPDPAAGPAATPPGALNGSLSGLRALCPEVPGAAARTAPRLTVVVDPAGRVPAHRLSALTRAERRVAALAAEGCRNREIARRLFITVSTVEQHLTKIYRKLGVTSRAGLPAADGD